MVPTVTDPGRVVAHRGASATAPENTLGAFRAAHAQGARWIEFDVTLLGDGTAVVHHDATLDRCTNRTGPLSAIGAADLAGIEAGPGEPLPTLAEVLDLIGELGLHANLEVKPNGVRAGLTSDAAARLLAARPWARDRVIVSSFSVEELARCRALMPAQPLAVLHRYPPKDWGQIAVDLGAAAIHVRRDSLTQDLLDEAAGLGLDARVFTVNDPRAIEQFRGQGLAGVITDHPPAYLCDPAWRHWAAG